MRGLFFAGGRVGLRHCVHPNFECPHCLPLGLPWGPCVLLSWRLWVPALCPHLSTFGSTGLGCRVCPSLVLSACSCDHVCCLHGCLEGLLGHAGVGVGQPACFLGLQPQPNSQTSSVTLLPSPARPTPLTPVPFSRALGAGNLLLPPLPASPVPSALSSQRDLSRPQILSHHPLLRVQTLGLESRNRPSRSGPGCLLQLPLPSPSSHWNALLSSHSASLLTSGGVLRLLLLPGMLPTPLLPG